jgi:hypothetical protein
MDNPEITTRLESLLGKLSEVSAEIEVICAEIRPRESDDNIYIRALRRLSPDLYCEIVDWKEAEGLPGLAVTVRDGRRAIITFSVDLENYHVLIDGRL